MAIPKLIHYSDNSYVTSQGTLFEGFETFADWTITGTGATASADSTHKKQGMQSLRLNSVNGVLAVATKTINKDFSAATNFILWVYIDDVLTLTNFLKISFGVSSVTDWSKHFEREITADHHKHGWNRFVVDKASFTAAGGESWSNTMIRMVVMVQAASGKNVSVCFDDLRYDYDATAVCILTFDDTHAGHYDYAYFKMATNSQKGVEFAIIDDIGTGGSLTKAQLTTMQTAGWDISNHTKSHPHLAAISQILMEENIDAGYDWLVANGFSNGARFFDYPYGEYNQAVITKVKERHRIARSTIEGAYQPHFEMLDNDQELLLKGRIVDASIAPATVCGWIDDTIIQGGLLILIFHNIVESGATGGAYNKDDFDTISDYLLAHYIEIKIPTLSNYYGQQFMSTETSVIYLQHAAIVPYPVDYGPSESVGRAEDGRMKVYKHELAGDRKRMWRIRLPIDNSGSSGYKWRDLEYFYTKVAEGALRKCVYVDANSVQHLVRITGFAPQVIAAKNKYDVTLILEEDY